MTATNWVIRSNNKGTWEYYYETDGKTCWDSAYGIWGAKRFSSREEAETLMTHKINVEHWGGIFQIEEFTVSR